MKVSVFTGYRFAVDPDQWDDVVAARSQTIGRLHDLRESISGLLETSGPPELHRWDVTLVQDELSVAIDLEVEASDGWSYADDFRDDFERLIGCEGGDIERCTTMTLIVRDTDVA